MGLKVAYQAKRGGVCERKGKRREIGDMGIVATSEEKIPISLLVAARGLRTPIEAKETCCEQGGACPA